MHRRYDFSNFNQAVITQDGFLQDEATVTRTGVFQYRNADGSVRRELRHPDDVFDATSLASMKLIPITHDHPNGLVNADNCKDIAVGSVGENIRTDGRYVIAPLVITDSDTIRVAQEGKRALSLGYTADIEEMSGEYDGEPYDCRQRNIRYNHLSIVSEARAGKQARLNLDSTDAICVSGTLSSEGDCKPKVEPDLDTQSHSVPRKDTSLAKDIMVSSKGDAKPEVTDRLTVEHREELLERIDALHQRVDKLLGERDELRSQLANTSAQIRQDAKARCKLLQLAAIHLEEEVDDWEDSQIKQALIAKVSNADLTGKGETYLDARFDAAMDYLSQGIQRQQVGLSAKTHPRDHYIHRLGKLHTQEHRHPPGG